MNKISISVDKENLLFSKYNRDINSEDLNNTNVINVKKLKFTEDYILENIDLISTFVNLIIMKFKINKVIIKNLEIAETVLELLKKIDSIRNICFSEDKPLNYTISSLLMENKNLDKIECYNLPDIMFYKLDSKKIYTRCKILSTSNFMKNNNINTYSEIYNKEKIIIDEYLSEYDIDDIIYFFNTNKNLKKIVLKRYSRQNLETILKFLYKNHLKKVTIVIYEDSSTTKLILSDINKFSKLNKKYNVNIKVKYSKEYKNKNKIKELNIILLRNIIIFCIIICIVLLLLLKIIENKDKKTINNNLDMITDITENLDDNKEVITDSNEVSEKEETSNNTNNEQNKVPVKNSYNTSYKNVYDELLKINKDTVGWLKVNNTKIDYPVVQYKDNDYYLNHAFDGSVNMSGWIYADYRNDINNLDKNTIIYGHNVSGTNLMFTTLKNVLNSNWYNNSNNLKISFSVIGKEYSYQIFSIYTIEKTSDYLLVDFDTDYSYMSFINKIKNRSIKNFNIELKPEDKILTLSTCYGDDTKRLVVHAKMI